MRHYLQQAQRAQQAQQAERERDWATDRQALRAGSVRSATLQCHPAWPRLGQARRTDAWMDDMDDHLGRQPAARPCPAVLCCAEPRLAVLRRAPPASYSTRLEMGRPAAGQGRRTSLPRWWLNARRLASNSSRSTSATCDPRSSSTCWARMGEHGGSTRGRPEATFLAASQGGGGCRAPAAPSSPVGRGPAAGPSRFYSPFNRAGTHANTNNHNKLWAALGTQLTG